MRLREVREETEARMNPFGGARRRECCVDGCRGLCAPFSPRCIRHSARHMIRKREENRVEHDEEAEEEASADVLWLSGGPKQAPPPSPPTTMSEEVRLLPYRDYEIDLLDQTRWRRSGAHQIPFRDENPGMNPGASSSRDNLD